MNWILVIIKDPIKSKLSYKERKWHELQFPWPTLSPRKFCFWSLIIMDSDKNKYLLPWFKMNKYVRKDRGHKTEIGRNMPTLRGLGRKWKDKRGWEQTARETENYKKVLHGNQEKTCYWNTYRHKLLITHLMLWPGETKKLGVFRR